MPITVEFILNRTVILLLLPHKQKLIMSQSVLSLKNITIYQEAKSILTEVNLEVNHGEFLYIIGKTGSGKSSLMKTKRHSFFKKKNWYCFSRFQITSRPQY